MSHRSDRVQLTAFAKSRVERAHLTLQDRLVKELRLRGISTVAAANAYAPTFMAAYNVRFEKSSRTARFKPWIPPEIDQRSAY